MTDKLTPEARSRNMSRIKGKNSKPELLVRRYLHASGFRFRIHKADLPGKPDIVLPKYKTVIFVNGCFWHGHANCKYSAIPKTKTEWWKIKIDKNKYRDSVNNKLLCEMNWRIITIFGCELRGDLLNITLHNLVTSIKTNALSE